MPFVRITEAFDSSAADTDAGFRYAFSTDPATLARATYDNSGAEPSASFSFAAVGTYTVYGRVLDKDGGHTDYSTAVVVAHAAPQVVRTVVNAGRAQRSDDESIAVTLNWTPTCRS